MEQGGDLFHTKEERDRAFAILTDLGLRKFVGAIMYIESVVSGIDKDLMLCQPNEKEGSFLLEEIMRGGNFGHYDERNRFYSKNARIRRGVFTLKKTCVILSIILARCCGSQYGNSGTGVGGSGKGIFDREAIR